MAAVRTSPAVDLECGYGGSGSAGDDDDSSSVCFSDAGEGSCCSQFYSTADGDGSHDDDEEIIMEAMDSRRASSVADSDCSVEIIESGIVQMKSFLAIANRDCRICHLSLEGTGPESGIAIELGCSCKDDLAVSHKHCAEAWFKIKGNKVCEICNSIARNVIGVNDIESGQQTNQANSPATTGGSEAGEAVTRPRRNCPDGRLLNFVLAFMVFAFVLSWLFHFNVHS